MGKFSRDKGKRGELEAMHYLGGDFKRTGYAGTDNPDLSSSWALISVKNLASPLSLNRCLDELAKLETQDTTKEHFVMIKVNHVWLIVQTAEQFRDARC
jgi:hypothetical protein